MQKNEYRRALILLRALDTDARGHVRLERRTMLGTMQFTLSGLQPQESPLQAALAGETASGWKIVHIGTMHPDARGQAGLYWTFDPRSIEGRTLEEYSLLLILSTGEGNCRMLFSGAVQGARQVDWARVQAAACQSYRACANADCPSVAPSQEQSSGDDASPEDPKGQEQEASAAPTDTQEQSGSDARQEPEAPVASIGNPQEQSGSDARQEPEAPMASIGGPQEQSGSDTLSEPVPDTSSALSEERESEQTELLADRSEGVVERREPACAEETTPLQEERDVLDIPAGRTGTATALEELDSGNMLWPNGYLSLRQLFASAQASNRISREGVVFAQVPGKNGAPCCFVGVRQQAGSLKEVLLALPEEALACFWPDLAGLAVEGFLVARLEDDNG